MAQQFIGLGAAGGDGTGDNLRAAGAKLVANSRDVTLKHKVRDIVSRYNRAKNDNPRTRAVMAAPPGMAIVTAAPAYTQQFPAAPAAAADFAPHVRHIGGWPAFSGGKLYQRAVTVDSTAAVNRSATTNSNGTQFTADFMTDAPQFAVLLNRGNTTYATIKAIIDGQYASAAGVNVPDAAFASGWLPFDFTSVGGRSLRHIMLEGCSDNAFGSVYTDAQSTVFAPADHPGPTIMIITDSYGVGAGATAAVDSWARQIAHYLGCNVVIVNAIGGTGYLIPHGTGHDTVLDRINAGDVAAINPDFIILPMGINDATGINAGTITRANFQARLPVTYTALRAAAPNVPIMVVGPWTPGGINAAAVGNCDDDIANAVTAFADPLMWNVRTYRRKGYNYPTSQIVKPIMWGTGNTGTPAGSGSNDNYTGPDGIHPPTAGHNMLARWLAGEFVAGISALAA